MAAVDFIPVQSLLGKEVCFRDLDFEAKFQQYSSTFGADFYSDRFVFGLVNGCSVDLDATGEPSYTILIKDEYYSLSEVDLLYVSEAALI